jgi:hypothetical protein
VVLKAEREVEILAYHGGGRFNRWGLHCRCPKEIPPLPKAHKLDPDNKCHPQNQMQAGGDNPEEYPSLSKALA